MGKILFLISFELYKNKKILAVIPARGGSKGIPMKNLKTINGKSLIEIVSNCVENCQYIDNSVLSSDNEEILNEGKKFGLYSEFKRPKNLSGDRVSDIPVLIHSLNEMEKRLDVSFDIIIMLQPTAPNRKSKDIDNIIIEIVDKKFDTVWTVNEVDLKFHPDKQLVINNDKNLRYFTEKGKSIISRQELNKTFMKNGNAYALTKNFLLEEQKLLGKKSGFIIQKDVVINIDTIEDLLLAEKLLKKNVPN